MKARKTLALEVVAAIAHVAVEKLEQRRWPVTIAVGVSGQRSSEDVRIARAGIAAPEPLRKRRQRR